MKRIEKLGLLAVLMAFSIVLGAGPAFSEEAENAYPLVKIKNSTPYSVSGMVYYRSGLCKNDSYGMGPWQEWEASSRGVCLVTQITANVVTPEGTKSAKPYTSSGTSYSQFMIGQINPNPLEFEVTRRTNSSLALDSNGDENVADGWEYSDWFGLYYSADTPWVFHPEHQWLYASTDSIGAMTFWDPKMVALVWTDEVNYPYIYRFADGAWLYYQKGSKNPRYFYNFNTKAWETY